MKLLYILPAFLVLFSSFVIAEELNPVVDDSLNTKVDVSTVVDMDEAIFAETISKSGTIVKFGTDWCPHCKEFEPIFEEVAKALPSITFGSVDCEKTVRLCETLGVEGYPSVFYVTADGKSTVFSKERTVPLLTKWVKQVTGPSYMAITTPEELEEIQGDIDGDKLVVMKTHETDSKDIYEFVKASAFLRETALFVLYSNPEVTEQSITLYRDFDELEVSYPTIDISHVTLIEFVKFESIPLIDEIRSDNFEAYSYHLEQNKPVAWLFLDDEDEDDIDIIMALKPVAKLFKQQLLFTTVDPDHSVDFGLKSDVQLLIEDRKNGHIFIFPLDDLLEPTSVSAFVQKFLDGELNRSYRSADEPVEDVVDGIHVIVGNTYDKFVEAHPDQHRLLFVYSQFSEESTAILAVLKRIAIHFPSLRLGMMDIAENDIPSEIVEVQKIPSMLHYGATKLDVVPTPSYYQGELTFDGLVQFVGQFQSAEEVLVKDEL